jgi:toxin ParE1/3/4
MSVRYTLGPKANADLKSISKHIAQHNSGAAQRLKQLFVQRFGLLANNPLMGEARPDLAPELRMMSIGNYVIIFRPSKLGVEIVRVVHGARELDALFHRSGPD